MPVPWLAVGSLVLSNLDKIMAVMKPAFTRQKIDALDNQTDLLNQQIAELQAAAAANAEQIAQSRGAAQGCGGGARSGAHRGRRANAPLTRRLSLRGLAIFGRRAGRSDHGAR